MRCVKPIAVLSQFDFDISGESYKTMLEAYSDYDMAIKCMDERVLSFINELVFKKYEIIDTKCNMNTYNGAHQFRIHYKDGLGKSYNHCLILEFVNMIS